MITYKDAHAMVHDRFWANIIALSDDDLDTSKLANGTMLYLMDTDKTMIWDVDGSKWWNYVDPDPEDGGVSGVETVITGVAPLTLPDAVSAPLVSLIQYGKMVQDTTPTPDAPVWPVINNGTVRMVRPSGLPVRYQMVEWLTVTSPSKRITITGFKTKSTQEFECKWYRSAKINCYLYASDASGSLTTNTTAYLSTANGTWRFDGRAAGFSAPVETICTSIQNKDGVWVNESKVGGYGDAGDFVSTNDLYLLNGSGSAYVRLYYLKVSESGNLVLDLVPVRDNVDGTYGVYDKISGEFYTNAEVTFEVGADIEDAPYVTTDGTPEVLMVGASGAEAQTATVPNLYAVGDYKDEAEVISGAVTRKVGMKVLDGTEEWYVVTGFTDIYGLAVADGIFAVNQPCVSSHYVGTNATNANMVSGTIKAVHASVLARNKVSVYIKDTANGTSLADFKAYLAAQYDAGTPVIVWYPLVTPVPEQTAPQSLSTEEGTNVVSITANVSDIALEVTYMKEGE